VVSQVKLIAEPWDLGAGGYQVGNFPVLWTEWNGKYRDCVRRFWRGDRGAVSELATRLAGSADLYAHSGRRPYASINFVTSHDGFSLHDLVSHNHKHNENNGEHNADGENHNLSWNSGVEGPTDDPAIVALRERQKRNLMTTLLVSQGVPMIRSGDELGQTQNGNNNAYCQDNEISWLDWDLDDRRQAYLDFVREVTRIRRENRALRRRRFLHGDRVRGSDIKDLTWFTPSGREMKERDWQSDVTRCLGLRLVREPSVDDTEREPQDIPNTVILLFNSHHEAVFFKLPAHAAEERWQLLIDTAHERPSRRLMRSGHRYDLRARSVAVLRLVQRPNG
jgi:glycogen operon protein